MDSFALPEFASSASSETQGQIVGARERLNGRKKMARRKVKFSPFFTFLRAIFFRPFSLSFAPTICPWVSEDASSGDLLSERLTPRSGGLGSSLAVPLLP